MARLASPEGPGTDVDDRSDALLLAVMDRPPFLD
jgi:hypothetical protein